MTVLGVVTVVIALYYARTRSRNEDWVDNVHIFLAATEAAPNCAKMHWNAGIVRNMRPGPLRGGLTH